MIQESNITEEISNKITFMRLLHKKLKWYQRPLNIFIFYHILISIPVFILNTLYSYSLLYFIWIFFTGVVFILLFHYSNRLYCRFYSGKIRRRGLLWVFPQGNYDKKAMKLLLKGMKKAKVLRGSKKDIKVVKSIKKYVSNNHIPKTTSYPLKSFLKTSWPLITLIFGIYATLLLTHSQNFEKTSNLVLLYSILLFTSIFLFIQIDALILFFINIKYRKQQLLIRRLDNLESYLKIKYDH